MSQTLQMLYQSSYETLVWQRERIIEELDSINDQIRQLKKEAKAEKIIIQN